MIDVIVKTVIKIDNNNNDNQIIEKINKKRLIINARGIKYDVILNQFSRLPESRLGKLKSALDIYEKELNRKIIEVTLSSICDDFDLDKNEFYFNRDPYIFNMILNYYSTGGLHFDNNVCPYLIGAELKYWQIDEFSIDDCCQNKYFNNKDDVSDEIKNKVKTLKEYNHKDDFGKRFFPKLREKIWVTIENPKSSHIAKVKFFNLIL